MKTSRRLSIRRRIGRSLLAVGMVIGVCALISTTTDVQPASAAPNTYTASLNPACGGGWSTVAVPKGVISASINLAGAGGGSGRRSENGNNGSGSGGAGARVTATVNNLTSVSNLSYTVGCGGGRGLSGNGGGGTAGASGYGSGGAGGVEPGAGGGGGSTALCTGSGGCGSTIAVAGGGGGGGATWRCCIGQNPRGGDGGASSQVGNNGGNGNSPAIGGSGASQSAAGPGGPGSVDGQGGSGRTGGAGGTSGGSSTGGGGGGGGYFGGGGGGGQDGGAFQEAAAGGGGGSSYVWGSTTAAPAYSSGGGGGGARPGGNSDGNNGGNGSISITWTVGASQLAITTQPPSSSAAQSTFGFVAQARDYQNALITGDAMGTPTVTLNPGSDCGPLVGTPSVAYNAATGNFTVTNVRIDNAANCAGSTLTIKVRDNTTGIDIEGTTAPFTITKLNQTVAFDSAAPTGAVVGGSYTVAATATSGLPATFSSADTSICTVSGSTVTPVAVGVCVVNANQPGNGTYNAAPQVQQFFSVAKGSQSITFTSTPPDPASVGDTYTVTATANSGLPVTFSSGSPSNCSVSSTGTVTFLAVGTCTINADQAGDANWNAAAQVQQSFTVVRKAQTITFTSTPPANAAVGDTYTVAATASSGLPVAFSSGTPGVCSVSGTTVTLNAEGPCAINANQGGDGTYLPATQAQQIFNVTKKNQTITFGSTAPSPGYVSDTYVVSASSDSGLGVTISILTPSVCSLSGSTVTFNASGDCVINANQAGNGTYNPASQVQQVIQVVRKSQTITVTNPPTSATVGGTVTINASATSGLPVQFISTTSGVCTVDAASGVVTAVSVGTCGITISQGGNGTYEAATPVSLTIDVVKADQTISITSTPPSPAYVGGSYSVTATATSGLPLTYSTADAAVCTVNSAGAVTFVAEGSCTVRVDQAGNSAWNAAPQVSQTFAITKQSQTVSFTSTPPSPAYVGDTYGATATATSGLPVAYGTNDSAICTVNSSGLVSFVAEGSCTVTADQAGNNAWNAAPQVNQTFSIVKKSQTITFTSTPPSPANVGDTYTVTATATSGLPVSFVSDDPAICTVDADGLVTLVAEGTCSITATQGGNNVWSAATPVTQTFDPTKQVQTIAFTSTPPSPAYVGDTYTAAATASSGLPVTYDTTDSAICTVNTAGLVTFVAEGACTVTADQAGNTAWNAATQASQSVSIVKKTQTITFTSTPPSPAYVGDTYTVAATSDSGLPVTFTSVDDAFCTVDADGLVTFVQEGTCAITADQAGDANWYAAQPVFQSFEIVKKTQTITFTSTPPSPANVGDTYTVTATATSGLPVTFTSDDTAICTVDTDGLVTLVAEGTCSITATQAGDNVWSAAVPVTQTFDPTKQVQTITITSTPPSPAYVGDTYTVTAESTSGLPVTFASADETVCTVDADGLVTFVGEGSCVITADQVGNDAWNAATQANQTIDVSKHDQTITFDSTPPNPAYVGGTYTLEASATSGLAVTFGTTSSGLRMMALAAAAAPCSVSGDTVSFDAPGTCVIYANQFGDTTWAPAAEESQSFEITIEPTEPTTPTTPGTTPTTPGTTPTGPTTPGGNPTGPGSNPTTPGGSKGGALPRTGIDTRYLGVLAGLLMTVGGGILISRRRFAEEA